MRAFPAVGGVLVHRTLSTTDRLLDLAQKLAPYAAQAIFIVIVTYVVARLVTRRLRWVLGRGRFQVNSAILLARGVWLALWVVGLFLALSTFGFTFTPLAALVGVIGLALSLSLQSLLQNLVAGVYLLAEHPFTIGDVIAAVGPGSLNHEGRVEDIQMRSTHLRNRDGELILVPNSAIFSAVITNRTVIGGFVQHMLVTFPRDTDPDEVRQRLVALLRDDPVVLAQPPPDLRVEQVATEDWTGSVSVWTNAYTGGEKLVWTIASAFPDATINVPAAAS